MFGLRLARRICTFYRALPVEQALLHLDFMKVACGLCFAVCFVRHVLLQECVAEFPRIIAGIDSMPAKTTLVRFSFRRLICNSGAELSGNPHHGSFRWGVAPHFSSITSLLSLSYQRLQATA